jgi:flagellar biosynthesis component FlhA
MSDGDTNGFSNAFDEHIRSISKQVIEEEFAKQQTGEGFVTVDPEAIKLQHRLQRIMSKEFISAKEAAVLLNCSERHIHNLVDRARRQIGDNPIPFRKVGEVTTFLRTELLEWTKERSSNHLRAVS